MTTTESSHIRSANNGTPPRESSPTSNTQIDRDAESESALDVTQADALHTQPDTEESLPVYNEGPSNLNPNRSLSYDRLSDVMGAVFGAGNIQHSDTNNSLRTMHSRSIVHSRHSESGSDRQEHHTTSSNHSIRTPLSEPNGIHQNVSSTSVESRRPWTPIFLQTATILCFIIAYALLLVALIILGILDDRNQGLATVGSNIRYVWTYGPTAVLATLAGLWGQVEHRTKQMMPWAILQKGSISAADALLLNYIEPAQPISLYTSVKDGHYAVTFAMVGSLLIQLLTIVSTGLLILQVERTHHRGVPIQTAEAFRLNLTDEPLGSSPILSAIALNRGNLSYPLGTSDRFAFSTLHLKNTIPGAENISIETTTDVFHAELGCEIVTEFHWNDTYVSELDFARGVISFATSSCHVENLPIVLLVGSRQKGLFGSSNLTRCDNSSSSTQLVLVVANFMVDLEYHESPYFQVKENRTLTIYNTSLFLCQPSYAIEPWSITVNGTGTLANEGSKSLLGSTNASSLPLSQSDFLEWVYDSIGSTGFATTELVSSVEGSDAITLDYFFKPLVAFSMPPKIADLLDANVLLNETALFFSMASAQMARNYLMTPSSKAITGTVVADELRLRIRGLSLYLMMATLVVLIADAAVLCFVCPRSTVSRDPGSLGGLALIMKESPSTCDILRNKSLWKISRLRCYLSNYQGLSILHLSNSNSSEFRVVLTRSRIPINNDISAKANDPHGLRWWQPISTHLLTKVATTLFLLILIAALESTYQTSKSNDGLADVETESYVRYTWAYAPAVAMSIVQLLVGMIGDSSRIIFPYHELRRKLNYTTENLFEDPLSKIMVHLVYTAIRFKQYALLATGLSMLLTPFLTIVSSGLFFPEPTTHIYDSMFKIDNVLNTSFDPLAASGGHSPGSQSSFILSLILTKNLSYPEWTYQELAFHEMTIDTIKGIEKDMNGLYPNLDGLTIHATVPAIRATLHCTYFAPKHVYVSYFDDTNSDRPYTEVTIHTAAAAQLSLPEECRNNTVKWATSHKFSSFESQPFAGLGNYLYDPSTNCSHLLAAFGPSVRNGSAQTMACVPVVEQVQTDTIFSLPSHRILAATANDTTAVPIADMTAAINLDNILPYGPFSGDTDALGDESYDGTFEILLSAPGVGTLEAADFDAANAEHPKIAAALQHLFRLTYAQVLNLYARSDVPANASTVASGNISMPTRLEGQIVDPRAQMRLKQSAVSTRILEGLLGAIVVCLLVSFWLLDTRKVMPENACSIAVAASLIAGAEMLREVPNGAEWWDDGEAVKKEVFGKDAVFSLGWWGAEERDGEIGESGGDTGGVVERDGIGEVREVRRRRFGIDRGGASSD